MTLDTLELINYNDKLNSVVKQLLEDDNNHYVKQVEEQLDKSE